MRKTLSVIGAALVLVLIGGVAVASIPDSSGVIHGCRKASDGTLRVIDTAVTTNCPNGFVPLNWQAGIYYVKFTTVTIPGGTDFNNRIPGQAFCNVGDVATGGGYDVNTNGEDVVVVESTITGSAWNGWLVQAINKGALASDAAMNVFVLCTSGTQRGLVQ